MSLILLSIIILTFIYSGLYTSLAYKAITNDNQNLLSKVALDINVLHNEISNIYVAAESTTEIEVFLNSKEFNELDEYYATRMIQKLRNIYLSKVHSIFLYNGALDYYISTDGQRGSGNYFANTVNLDTVGDTKAIIPRYIQFANTKERVLSYVFPSSAGYMFCSHTVENLNWRVVMVDDYQGIVRGMNEKRNEMFLISLIVLLTSSFIAFFLASWISLPIDKLKLKMIGWGYTKTMPRDELKFISESVSEMVMNMVSLKEHKDLNIRERKEEYLRNLLLDAQLKPIQIEDIGEINLAEQNVQSNLIVIDNISAIPKEYLPICAINIRSAVLKNLNQKMRYEIISLSDYRLCILVNDNYDENRLLKSVLLAIQEDIYETSDISLTIGIGITSAMSPTGMLSTR